MSGRTGSSNDWERLAIAAAFKPGKLAALYSISERQLRNRCLSQFGKSPRHFLRELQCRPARKLLLAGYSNKEVAELLKFADAAHFCREFKKAFGMTPRAFVKAANAARL